MKRREILTPDLTPLIDVLFILLLFFMVSSVFKKEELALTIELPESETSPLQQNEQHIAVEIAPSKIACCGTTVTLVELRKRLQKLPDKSLPVTVRIDKTVRYDRIVSVLDLLQKYHMTNLSLITQNATPEK